MTALPTEEKAISNLYQILAVHLLIRIPLVAMIALSLRVLGEEYCIEPEDPLIFSSATRLEKIIRCLAKHESVDLLLGAGSDSGDGWWWYLVLPDDNHKLDYKYVRFVRIRYDEAGSVIGIESTGGAKTDKFGPKQRVSDKIYSELAKPPNLNNPKDSGTGGQREGPEKPPTSDAAGSQGRGSEDAGGRDK